MTIAKLVLMVGTAVWAVGCDGPREAERPAEPAEEVPEANGPPAAVAAALDSGNAAFRARDYQAALGHYTRATEEGPEVGAAWFGVYMARLALGDTAAAAEAMERARELAPGMAAGHGLPGHTPGATAAPADSPAAPAARRPGTR